MSEVKRVFIGGIEYVPISCMVNNIAISEVTKEMDRV